MDFQKAEWSQKTYVVSAEIPGI